MGWNGVYTPIPDKPISNRGRKHQETTLRKLIRHLYVSLSATAETNFWLYDEALLFRTGTTATSSKSLLQQPQRERSIVPSPAFTLSFSASSFTVLIIFFLMSCNLGREWSCNKLQRKAWSNQAVPCAKQTYRFNFAFWSIDACHLLDACLAACPPKKLQTPEGHCGQNLGKCQKRRWFGWTTHHHRFFKTPPHITRMHLEIS